MKPFTLWLNAAKREMKQLKKGLEKMLIEFGTQRDFRTRFLHLSSMILKKKIHSSNGHGLPELTYLGVFKGTSKHQKFWH